jgi:putative tricarboxylic transport membrane protein
VFHTQGRRLLAIVAIAGVAPLTIAACGSSDSATSSNGAAAGGKQIRKLTLLVGTEPGGGFDLTARAFAKAAKDAGLASNVQVQNIPGAGSTIALARLANQKGTAQSMQLMGLGLVGGIYANKSQTTLANTTPVARLTQEPDIIVVAKDSKYMTLADLLADWKANPGKRPVGSGSSPGGPDHIATMLTAQAAGIDPKQVNHVTFDGGGELNAALLGNKVAFGVTGVTEVSELVKAGKLRPLAVTGAQRVPGLDAPALKEAGLDVEFVNWRGLVAPPGLSAADQRMLTDFAKQVTASAGWKQALAKNQWISSPLFGSPYKSFVDAESGRVADIMSQLGLST